MSMLGSVPPRNDAAFDDAPRPEKGSDFEDMVAAAMAVLTRGFPGLVSVERQPELRLQNGRRVRPDFELVCRFHHSTDHSLIECQNRARTDHLVVDRIRTIKSLS